MLWPLVLPFKITFWVLAALVATATVFAPVANCTRLRAFLVSLIAALVLFVPSCSAVMAVIDASRFGRFQAASFEDVDDFRVERYLPPAARDITLEKQAQGYRAKFVISQSDLDAWFENFWDRYGERSVVQRDEIEPHADISFQGLDWKVPEEAAVYVGPIAGNGAGFTLWYDSTTETAFQCGYYW